MGEHWQRTLQRIREFCLPLQRFIPFIASALTLVAGFCQARSLRYLAVSVSVVLFLFIAANLARLFLDKDLNKPAQYASYQPPAKNIPVNTSQIVLTAMLALIYASMIFAGLLLLASALMFLLMIPGVLVVSALAAWRNVRLWYCQGADYEQALKEETRISPKLHIPPRS